MMILLSLFYIKMKIPTQLIKPVYIFFCTLTFIVVAGVTQDIIIGKLRNKIKIFSQRELLQK